MKQLLLAALLCAPAFHVFACADELVGVYTLRNSEGERVEVLKLERRADQLVAFMKGNSGWDRNPQDVQPYPAEQFAAFTRLPAPPDYCGIVVSGLIVARVPKGWQWAGLAVQSGYVVISLGGPREAYRVSP
ncbi:MAG: hypothetical protein WC809_03045 [Sinimarinibacterium sp.]|jgi:hypothetical protein